LQVASVARTGEGTEKTLAVHPGSGSERKNWPESAWARLLERIVQETDWRILLVGGEAEGERLQRLSGVLPPQRIQVAQSLPLAELALRLAGCQAFLGHDSGISHLAAALGLPGLALWGETNEAVWRPPSSSFRILRSLRTVLADGGPAVGGIGGIPPELVLAELRRTRRTG
jgi:heptosyltransferase-2